MPKRFILFKKILFLRVVCFLLENEIYIYKTSERYRELGGRFDFDILIWFSFLQSLSIYISYLQIRKLNFFIHNWCRFKFDFLCTLFNDVCLMVFKNVYIYVTIYIYIYNITLLNNCNVVLLEEPLGVWICPIVGINTHIYNIGKYIWERITIYRTVSFYEDGWLMNKHCQRLDMLWAMYYLWGYWRCCAMKIWKFTPLKLWLHKTT